MTPSSELESVNVILTNLGEAPVNTITGNLPLEAAQALATLREVSREVQKRGWYFNTEHHVLQPDTDGFINLPRNTLDVRSDYNDRGSPVVQRGTRLYNMTPREHGFTFEEPRAVRLIIGLEYNELPQIALSYIFLRAARVFQVRQLGDQVNTQDDNTDEQRALTELQQENVRIRPYSLRDSVSIAAALAQRPTVDTSLRIK